MSINLPDGRTSLRTVLVNRASGNEEVLFERPGSRCHFVQHIEHNGHSIRLRVDWGDLHDGDPTLDADIYEILKGGVRGERLPNGSWHHTRLTTLGPGDVRGYVFCFQGLELELIARKTLGLSSSLNAYIVDEASDPPSTQI